MRHNTRHLFLGHYLSALLTQCNPHFRIRWRKLMSTTALSPIPTCHNHHFFHRLLEAKTPQRQQHQQHPHHHSPQAYHKCQSAITNHHPTAHFHLILFLVHFRWAPVLAWVVTSIIRILLSQRFHNRRFRRITQHINHQCQSTILIDHHIQFHQFVNRAPQCSNQLHHSQSLRTRHSSSSHHSPILKTVSIFSVTL